MNAIEFFFTVLIVLVTVYFTALATTIAVLDKLGMEYSLKPESNSKWFRPIKSILLALGESDVAISIFKRKFEKKAFENERKKEFSEALEFLNSTKDTALKAQAKKIRHDLRSPLTALNTVLDALKVPDDLIIRWYGRSMMWRGNLVVRLGT